MVRRLIGDTRRLGRAADGFAAELRLFAQGWRVPADYAGPRWRIALSGGLVVDRTASVWGAVADGDVVVLEDAGVLAQFSHADVIATLFE